jgi:hypothetical protein
MLLILLIYPALNITKRFVNQRFWALCRYQSPAVACRIRLVKERNEFLIWTTPRCKRDKREINFPTFHWAIGFAELANHGACGLAGRAPNGVFLKCPEGQ